jgi:hypothetical protein
VPFNGETVAVLSERLQRGKIAKPHPKDPEKLATIKATLTERCDRYFVCLVVPGIPLDNNKAERALRKIVLKRKKSFGSKTQKGADVLSVLYSVVFSIFWNYPKEEFFEKYMEAVGGSVRTYSYCN